MTPKERTFLLRMGRKPSLLEGEGRFIFAEKQRQDLKAEKQQPGHHRREQTAKCPVVAEH